MTREDTTSIQTAPMWQRGLAAIVDISIVLGSLYYAANRWGVTLPNGSRGWHGWTALFVLFLTGAYWVVPEWLFGLTIGKVIFGIRVLSVSGKSITFVQPLKRNLLRPIDFIFFYLTGFIVAILSPLRQRAGDQWAHTVVGDGRAAGPPLTR